MEDLSPDRSPIGTAVMDTSVLKEPRGLMRILEWFFAIVAFATCCDFSTFVEYSVTCTSGGEPKSYKHDIYYPFQIDHIEGNNVTCGATTKLMYLPGDFSSDAQFFVFTGVISFLSSMAILVLYIFFSDAYGSENKRAPLIDFCFTVIVAVFWLSASAAWANGVINLKYAANPDHWLYDSKDSICVKDGDHYVQTAITACKMVSSGTFKKANVSIIVGFLNFFLWASNLWFLYKETSWFSGGSQQPEQMAA